MAKVTGKYAAPRKRGSGKKKMCRFLYILNILVLILAAVRVFSTDEAPPREDMGLITEAIAATEPKDTVAPVISGVEDITVYAGETVSYRSGVTVTDDRDANPSLTVDSSMVDLSQTGTYFVTYFAQDAAGNQSSVEASVIVLPSQEGFAELQDVFGTVDTRLAEIITEDMTTRQQVEAIYAWVQDAHSYAGHSTRTDYYQAAYEMLVTGKGDCYGYFAVSKLMFKRLGIPNIDVRKVKNSEEDSDHFWSLVSLDGGSTYYHFDCTPRLGTPFDFCLITDAQLDGYSQEHKNSHNRDASLYPATPEE